MNGVFWSQMAESTMAIQEQGSQKSLFVPSAILLSRYLLGAVEGLMLE